MKKKYPRIKLLLAAIDLFLLISAILLSFFIRYKTDLFGSLTEIPRFKLFIYIIILIPYIIIFRLNNLYKQRIFLSAFEQFVQLAKSLFSLIAIYVIAIFLLRNWLIEHSRSLVGLFFLISLLLLSLGRIVIFRYLYTTIKNNGILRRRIAVIGAGEAGKELLEKIEKNPLENIEVVCFFDDNPNKKGGNILGAPILGTTEDLEFYLQKLKIDVDGIYISISFISYEDLIRLITKCKGYGYPVYLDSKHFKVINERIDVHEFESLLSPAVYGSSNYFYTKFLKRLYDLVFSAVFFVIFSPFFLLISILIKITSRGPIFFKPRVIGKEEKEFFLFKFRTMKINEDPSIHKQFMFDMIKEKKKKGILKIKNDKRVTKIGKYLRKFSIDELPQLINILKGEMSLIGPRPSLSYEYSMYEEWHKMRFTVKPGLTGLWQAFGRSSVSYDDMVIMDLYYIENISFWLDLKILLKTIPTVLFGKGAY